MSCSVNNTNTMERQGYTGYYLFFLLSVSILIYNICSIFTILIGPIFTILIYDVPVFILGWATVMEKMPKNLIKHCKINYCIFLFYLIK